MRKRLNKIFSIDSPSEPLFILEMANNHMGDVKHGVRIIRQMHTVTRNFKFYFAFKLQFRNISTFIHPDYKDRMDIKYVKRFSETSLSKKEFNVLLQEMRKLDFITMSTPFDEESVDLLEELKLDILKIGSPSFPDWPLLERIAKTRKPIIFSTGGAKLEDIDRVATFFQNREKQFAIMHCVGEYPTKEQNLQLNQIDLFQRRYPNVPIGFSTHEDPENFDAVKIAIAKGARIFEKHVAVKTRKYGINNYSATPRQVKQWLESAKAAYRMCGVVGERASASDKELSDLRRFRRGVFAKRRIKKDEKVDLANTFLAFPNQPRQLLATDLSKYTNFFAKKNFAKNEPILVKDVKKQELRQKVYSIIKKADRILKKYHVNIPEKVSFEISHHYGIDDFYKYGGILVDFVNREYCKKLIIMFAGQQHPTQYHKIKEETFHILGGEFIIELNGRRKTYKRGDIITVRPGVKHKMEAITDGLIEEISSTHRKADSFYLDEKIAQNKYRKTQVTYWID